MDNTNTDEALMAEFKQKVINEFIAKGIKPPAPGSQEEKELFDIWFRSRH